MLFGFFFERHMVVATMIFEQIFVILRIVSFSHSKNRENKTHFLYLFSQKSQQKYIVY